MPKGDSPEITAFVPPSEECPTVAARRIRTFELNDECARVVVEEIMVEKLGHLKWDIDFFTTPVTLEIKRKNRKTKTYTWDPSQFSCLREFLTDLRSRLPQPDIAQLREDIEVDMADIIGQVRDACVRVEERIIEINRVPSEADVVFERLRNTLGLTQLRRPSRRLANLAKTDLRRIPRSERGPIRLARWIRQVEAFAEVLLDG